MLPFTREQFVSVFADYNVGVWPAQILAYLLGLTIVAGLSDAPGVADALPLADDAGTWGAGVPTICRIRLLAKAHGLKAADPRFYRLVMAHETFHCFQFAIRGGLWGGVPLWLQEGAADWAALTVGHEPYAVGGANLTTYVESPTTPLFARAYDGVGAIGHAADLNATIWPHFATAFVATGDIARLVALTGDVAAYLRSAASAALERPTYGPEWYGRSPYLVGSAATAPVDQIWGPGVFRAAPWGMRHLEVDPASPRLPPDAWVMQVVVDHGDVRMADGTFDTTRPDGWWCLDEGGCTCPSGEEGTPVARTLSGPAQIELSSGPEDAVVGIRLLTQADFCRKRERPGSWVASSERFIR